MKTSTTLLALALVAAGLLAVAKPAQAGDTIYGYEAVADVRVPGGKVKKITITGGFKTAAPPDYALAQARNLAEARLRQYGSIQTGPVVNLCSPFKGTTEKIEDID
jgi:hypothetical protein